MAVRNVQPHSLRRESATHHLFVQHTGGSVPYSQGIQAEKYPILKSPIIGYNMFKLQLYEKFWTLLVKLHILFDFLSE